MAIKIFTVLECLYCNHVALLATKCEGFQLLFHNYLQLQQTLAHIAID